MSNGAIKPIRGRPRKAVYGRVICIQDANGVVHLTHNSIDDNIPATGKFILEVDSTMRALLKSEDLDGDGLITVDDCGPKVKGHAL